jgi:hypothetical protein
MWAMMLKLRMSALSKDSPSLFENGNDTRREVSDLENSYCRKRLPTIRTSGVS